jgi:Tfp pilus assembly protein PilF
LEPDASSPLLYLGLVLLRTNRLNEAQTYLDKAVAIDPTGYDFHLALGLLAQMRGERTLAERQYSQELRLHPENKHAQLSLIALHGTN